MLRGVTGFPLPALDLARMTVAAAILRLAGGTPWSEDEWVLQSGVTLACFAAFCLAASAASAPLFLPVASGLLLFAVCFRIGAAAVRAVVRTRVLPRQTHVGAIARALLAFRVISVEPEDALLNRRISVRWAGPTWYSGICTAFRPETHEHFVMYDDGTNRWYNLQRKTWRDLGPAASDTVPGLEVLANVLTDVPVLAIAPVGPSHAVVRAGGVLQETVFDDGGTLIGWQPVSSATRQVLNASVLTGAEAFATTSSIGDRLPLINLTVAPISSTIANTGSRFEPINDRHAALARAVSRLLSQASSRSPPTSRPASPPASRPASPPASPSSQSPSLPASPSPSPPAPRWPETARSVPSLVPRSPPIAASR